MSNSFFSLFTMPWFWSSFLGWTIAQTIKLVTELLRTHRIDFSYYVSTGGMPSAHSAMVSGLATSIGLTEGFDSAVFMLSLAFATITMFDAAGVRNAAGQQAKLLNQIVEELFTDQHFNAPKMKELLGHTRLEVFAGLVTGVIVALAVVSRGWPEMLSQ
jgi:acid phosphatase family membrane protein YuiD